LTATGDEDIGAFLNESLRARQPDTAAAAGDHGDLAIQSCHQFILILVVAVAGIVGCLGISFKSQVMPSGSGREGGTEHG
jgi:hypothetical protein